MQVKSFGAFLYREAHGLAMRQGNAAALAMISVSVVISPFAIQESIKLAWTAVAIAAFAAFSAYIQMLVDAEAASKMEDDEFERNLQEQSEHLRKVGWSDRDVELLEETRRSLNKHARKQPK